MTESPQQKSETRRKWIIAVMIVVLCLGIPCVWLGVTFWAIPRMPVVGENAGITGDSFGAVNALFSGLALAGVVVAILLQSEELKLQRQELAETRDELRGQKDQLSAQVKRGLQEEFDSRFFEVIRLWRDSVEGVNLPRTHEPNSATGSRAISLMITGYGIRSGFRLINDNNAEQLTIPMQSLLAVFSMLQDDRASDVHKLLLNASCGNAERTMFFLFLMSEQSTITKVKDLLNDMAFFKGLTPPDSYANLRGISKLAFGVRD
jgi:hypothetical protein